MHTSLVVLHLSRGTKSESRLSIIFAVPFLLQSGCYRRRVIKWNESFEGLSRKIKGKRNRLNLNYKENIFLVSSSCLIPGSYPSSSPYSTAIKQEFLICWRTSKTVQVFFFTKNAHKSSD